MNRILEYLQEKIKLNKKQIIFSILGSVIYFKRVDIIGSLVEYFKQNHTKYLQQYQPKNIILVRHGQSQGNVDVKAYATIPDNQIQLTQLGKAQASQIGKQLKQLLKGQYIHFYYSPFLRTKQTFQGIIESFDNNTYECHEDPRIRELEWGNLQEWSLNQELKEKILQDRKKVGHFFFRFENGESGADVYDRVSQFIGSLKRQLSNLKDCKQKNRSVVIIAHGLTIRLFIMRYFKLSVTEYYTMKNPDNCQCIILRKQDNGKYQILGKIKPEGVHLDDKQIKDNLGEIQCIGEFNEIFDQNNKKQKYQLSTLNNITSENW